MTFELSENLALIGFVSLDNIQKGIELLTKDWKSGVRIFPWEFQIKEPFYSKLKERNKQGQTFSIFYYSEQVIYAELKVKAFEADCSGYGIQRADQLGVVFNDEDWKSKTAIPSDEKEKWKQNNPNFWRLNILALTPSREISVTRKANVKSIFQIDSYSILDPLLKLSDFDKYKYDERTGGLSLISFSNSRKMSDHRNSFAFSIKKTLHATP